METKMKSHRKSGSLSDVKHFCCCCYFVLEGESEIFWDEFLSSCILCSQLSLGTQRNLFLDQTYVLTGR